MCTRCLPGVQPAGRAAVGRHCAVGFQRGRVRHHRQLGAVRVMQVLTLQILMIPIDVHRVVDGAGTVSIYVTTCRYGPSLSSSLS